MRHKHFLFRQLQRCRKQAVLFVVSVSLSIVTLVALAGFSASVHKALLADTRKLHAADIIISSNFNHSPRLSRAADQIQQQGRAASAKVYEFFSMVREPQSGASVLAGLKVVEAGYPFYGRVELKSGQPFQQRLTPGNIVVDQNLLDRLGLSVGSRLMIGKASLTIIDVATREPDRPLSLFNFGPRVFISAGDLEALDLLQPGSRVRYKRLLKVSDPDQVDAMANTLKVAALEGQESVATFKTAPSRIKRFFDRFLLFLGLIGVFTLLLAGVGIQSSLTAFFREQRKTIAILKTLGAANRLIAAHYLALIVALGVVGTLVGLLAGTLLQWGLPSAFSGIVPIRTIPSFSLQIIWSAIVLGTLVVALFAYQPLNQISGIKPAAIFRMETVGVREKPATWLIAAIILIILTITALNRIDDTKIGLSIVLGIVAFLLLANLLTRLILAGIRKLKVHSLTARQAVRGLFRPGNATPAVIVTLSAAVAVLAAIYLVQRNLDATFVHSYPPEAPNLFFVNIQPGQQDEFERVTGLQTTFYPIIRARVLSINDRRIDPVRERRRRGDNLARTFNLTYRDFLLPDEAFVQEETLFGRGGKATAVSVLDTVAEIGNISIGDRITFRIQGVPLEAVVSSIRTRTRESLGPYFYFVLPQDALKNAPQTIFTAARVDQAAAARLQNRVAAAFPNVSVINAIDTIDRITTLLTKLTAIIFFFMLFSLAAGVLIIVSSVLATRLARIREAVYFKILGARSGFVLQVFALENCLIGMIAALLAIAFSQTASWLICSRWLKIGYSIYALDSLIIIAATALLVMAVGLASSVSVLKKKPVRFLREYGND